MKTSKKKSDPWEDRHLGAQADFVAIADTRHENALNEALELQSISIRLPVELIKNYKLIAGFHGIGYQPLMRDILHRFVPVDSGRKQSGTIGGQYEQHFFHARCVQRWRGAKQVLSK